MCGSCHGEECLQSLGQNMAANLISCLSVNKEIWKDIHYFWTLIDIENGILF